MKTIYYPLFILLMSTFACNDGANPENTSAEGPMDPEAMIEEVTPANMAPEFVEVLEAHGGLDQWNSFQAVSFLLKDFPTGDGDRTISDFHRVNLGTREHSIEGEGYQITARGDSTWVSPDPQVTGIPPRMYQAASFYLFGMPFVFADAGITITYAGETEFGDATLDQFNIQIPDDLGDGGNDYQLYTDPQTHQLRYGTWSVTYPAVADMDLRQMASFEEFQSVNGLVVPSVITMYTAPGDIEPGTPGSTFSFERVAFTDATFATTIFEKPEGAVIDRSNED